MLISRQGLAMATGNAPTFAVGDFVNIISERQPILGVVLNSTAPLGFYQYDVLDVNTGKTHHVTRLQLEAASEVQVGFIDNFIMETADDAFQAPQEKPSSRFQACTDADIDKIQYSAKSAKTHKMTKWGVKIFRGKNCIYICM